MPEILKVSDRYDLVDTSEFKYLDFDFDKFNPVQSRIFEFYDQPANIVIAAQTSAGKTACAEMLLSHEVYKRGGRGMYIGPLKALSQEKIDDWTDKSHGFSDLNLSICTGDYRLTADRQEEMRSSNVVLMTSEMLSSRVRNYKSEHNEWLNDVGTLVTDESHLLTVPVRGDRLEIAIMSMARLNTNCRHVLLSATMPNVDDMAGWLTKLTDRDTYILESKYRPCPLTTHYVPYNDIAWKYEDKEREKVKKALEIVLRHSSDKFLIFAHTKRTGEMMKKALQSCNIETEFHNADLEGAKRKRVEDRFRNDSKFRVIVATSTLAAGINMPARRVIILGVHRGLEEVATYDIAQQSGRAGRPRYDPAGDVYILLPRKDLGKQQLRLENPTPIQSQIVQPGSDNFSTLAFHIVSEINQGGVDSVESIYEWFSNTLAAYQNKNLDDRLVERMVNEMLRKGIIKEEGGKLTVSPIGKVASLFYYDPFDVADLRRNFNTLFEHEKEEDVLWVATALAKLGSNFNGFISNVEAEQMGAFPDKLDYTLRYAFGKLKGFTPAITKSIYIYYSLLNGYNNLAFAGAIRGVKNDTDRLMQVLMSLDGMSAKWDKYQYFKKLSKRIQYGVSWDLLNLCSIPGIGKAKAQKLWQANLRDANAILAKPKLTKSVLGCSDNVLNKMMLAAQKAKDMKE